MTERGSRGSRTHRSPRRPRPVAAPLGDERQPARSNRLSQRIAAMIAQALARHDRQPPTTVLELPRTGTDVFTVEMSSAMGQSSVDQPSNGQPMHSQSRQGEAKQEPTGRARGDEGARRVTSWRARR